MAKAMKSGLFTQYLERVSGRLLEEYPQVIATMIRGHAGVYALYKGERLYYVGLASNLMTRVKQHQKDRHAKRWDKFSVYLASADEHIKPLESLLLRIALPKGNLVKGGLPGAVDQRRSLTRLIRQHDSAKYASLFGGGLARRQVRKATASAKGTLVLAGRLEKRIPLRAEYKGKIYTAALRKDGYISYSGDLYESPSAAGRAVVGAGHINGWAFWKYRKTGKGWVRLSELRK
ncbi:hypothetical protein FZO89_04360 [Luteimonas viscosa]|uniref:RAMA domain-containing protein n=2 Tax=Luteimonas viscosa TaxID=1132694 RepID=A0A5D4XNM1_9GAMM|nr:hypothetical protein FZO89_04360 [Luteimonas viscosa]